MIFRHVTGVGALGAHARSNSRSRKRAGLTARAAFTALSLAVLTMAPAVQADGDAAAGEALAHTCLGCHGVKHYVNSYPTYHVPKIAGQNAQYLVAALQAYRAKTRSHPTMQANAGLLSDQDMQDIAAWFASLGASK